MNTRLYIWLLIWVLPWTAMGQIPERPVPPRLVNDFSGILDITQQQSLEDMLVQFDKETGTQIAVVIVPSLEGYDKADFAFRIGEQWGVGQHGKNNGIVVLVKPKTGGESGQVYIAVGYGLEGVIPDAIANRLVVNQEMIPRFRENDYYGGIVNGVGVIMNLAKGEFTPQQYAEKSGHTLNRGGAAFLLILLILTVVVFPLMKRGSQVHSTGSRNLPWWLLLTMMNSGGKHRGGWSDFSSGRGSFGGGFKGGGFGGFGGGSFGGGGAGGSW